MTEGRKGGVSAAHPLAVQTGERILKKGGNAVDAAIAMSFVLGVVEPYGSGLGGGGVMLIHSTDTPPVFYDYRETAPLSGEISEAKVGVPGFVRGMETLFRDHAVLSWQALLEPAIAAAYDGFEAHSVLCDRLGKMSHLDRSAHSLFYSANRPVPLGTVIRQQTLAETLQSISRYGSEWFYEGPVARRIVERVKGMQRSDLQQYRVLQREPVVKDALGFRVVSAPPPLAGVTLLQALHRIESVRLDRYSDHSFAFIYGMSEILQRVHQDRKTTMGDPDFVDVDTNALLSEAYIERRLKETSDEGDSFTDVNQTTHFTVVDKEGTMVSATNTISDFFGSGLYVDGFFLNNQMKNFTDAGPTLNDVQPGKRPQSHIAPAILCRGRRPVLTIGSSGGRRIPTMMSKVLLRLIKNDCPLHDAVCAPRFYARDNHLYLEENIDETIKEALRRKGYAVEVYPERIFYGGIHGMMITEGGDMVGTADPRRGGTWKTFSY